MSYLQVICEQHRLVEQHLDKFTAPPASAEGEADPHAQVRARPSERLTHKAVAYMQMGNADGQCRLH